MTKPNIIHLPTFRSKLVGLLLAWLIIELLIAPLSSTGMAFALGERIGSDEIAAASIPSPASKTRKMEARVFSLINRVRSSGGLTELKINNYLSGLARQHSLDMATGKAPFGHQGFEFRTSLIKREIGAAYIAENVAYNEGYDDPANEAVKDWLASPKHLINIKGEYKLTGVGVASSGEGSYFYTQIFAR
ncbi:MAG: CAP domain-containing protein [Candidatus Margulisiibacteriota bacterium]